MPKVECCGVARKTQPGVWLKSNVAHFDFEILYEGFCPRCQHRLLAVCSYHHETGKGPLRKIQRKKHVQWLLRKAVDFHHQEETAAQSFRNTRKTTYVSEYSHMIHKSADIAAKYLQKKSFESTQEFPSSQEDRSRKKNL